MSLDGALLCGLIALLLLAPLPFGAVEPGWSALLVASAAVLSVVWIAGRCRRGEPALPWREPVFLAAAAFACVGAAQMVPLPPAVTEALSPTASDLRAALEPGGGEPAWRPLSLHPWATRQSLTRLAACVLVALVTMDLARRGSRRRALAWALMAGGAFQALYGLAEYVSGRQHIFGYAKRFYVEMATGTFINKNHYAGYLAMCLPVALAAAAWVFPRVRSSDQIPLLNRLFALSGRRVFAGVMVLLVAILIATALVSSRSRAGIACAMAGILAAGLATAVGRRRKGFAAAAALAVVVTLAIFYSQSRGATFVSDFKAAPESMTGQVGRWQMWTQAWTMAAAFPLTGSGLGTFEYVFPGFRSEAAGVFLAHAHNDYLEALTETGWIGLLVLAAGIGAVAVSLVRSRPAEDAFGSLGPASLAAVTAIALHSLVDFNLAIPANALTFAAVFGILVAWRRQGEAALLPATEAAPARRPSWLLRGLAPASAAALVAATALAPVVAALPEEEVITRASLDSPDASMQCRSRAWVARTLDGDDAARLFSEAAVLGRVAVADLQALGEAVASGNGPEPERRRKVERLLDEAIRLQEAGIRHAPTYPQGHLYRGHIEAALCAVRELGRGGDSACARAGSGDFARALRLNPMSATMHASVARYYIRAWPLLDEDGRREALAVIEKAAQMNGADAALHQALLAVRDEVKG